MVGNRRGFTLMELLLVVTVLSAVAWMSLGVVGNNADQVRFEDTRNRLQAIRRAIIGDTSRTVNGSPEVRGYVADMGGLPENLQALVIQDTQPSYAQDATTGLWSGWNGPYLPPGFGSTGRYLDGWGNNDGTNNYGWVYPSDITAITDLVVQSLGRDGVINGVQPYDADYPLASAAPLIDESEYRLKITDSGNTGGTGDATGGLRVDFGAAASCWITVGWGSCSDSEYTTKTTCESNSATWTWGEACSNPAYSTKDTCVNNGATWPLGSCSDSEYTTEATCVSNSATWTWGSCSDSAYSTKTTCESNSATWTLVKPRPRPDITNSADCGTANGTWQPTQNLCMAMSVVKDGALIQLISNGPIVIQWDGTQKIAEFIFEDTTSATLDEDTYLYQGQIAYGIFEYDSTATPPVCDTTKPFPAGSASWKNFTYVPGTTLQPFERKINP